MQEIDFTDSENVVNIESQGRISIGNVYSKNFAAVFFKSQF